MIVPPVDAPGCVGRSKIEEPAGLAGRPASRSGVVSRMEGRVSEAI